MVYKGQSLRSRSIQLLQLFLLLGIALPCISACGPSETSNSLSGASNGTDPCIDGENFQCAVEAAIFRGVNALRAQNGLGAVSYDGRLGYVARDWSGTMMRGEEPLGHNGFPNERNETLQNRFTNYSDIIMRSENVAFFSGFNMEDAEEVAARLMNQWANSAGHRANMLNSAWQIMGAGVTTNASSVYGTQIFGTFSNP